MSAQSQGHKRPKQSPLPIIRAQPYPSCRSNHKKQAKSASKISKGQRHQSHHAIKSPAAKASRPFMDRVHVRLRPEQEHLRQEQVRLRPTREDADKCKAVKIR